jgi:hypothetical protein
VLGNIHAVTVCDEVQGGSNMTGGLIFFLKTIIAKHLLAHVSL